MYNQDYKNIEEDIVSPYQSSKLFGNNALGFTFYKANSTLCKPITTPPAQPFFAPDTPCSSAFLYA